MYVKRIAGSVEMADGSTREFQILPDSGWSQWGATDPELVASLPVLEALVAGLTEADLLTDEPTLDELLPDEGEYTPDTVDDPVFESHQLLRREDVFYIEGNVNFDLYDLYAQHNDVERTLVDPHVADDWLTERIEVIDEWMVARYPGFEADAGITDWHRQAATFSITVPSWMRLSEALHELWNTTGAVALYNETDRGTYGSEYVWRLLSAHLRRREA
jgi:hypothetical protein